MQLTRSQKVKLARRMRTSLEEHQRVSIWDSAAWSLRRTARGGSARRVVRSVKNESAKPSLFTRIGNALRGKPAGNRAYLRQKTA